ncbi:MAG: hypothetical protein ACTSR2_01465 [Candidatus Hodarchaeales archaeon]
MRIEVERYISVDDITEALVDSNVLINSIEEDLKDIILQKIKSLINIEKVIDNNGVCIKAFLDIAE